MINYNTLDEAIDEALRFIKAAETLKEATSEAGAKRARERGHWSTVAEHASVKRASMDLTRKLADLRAGR